MRSIHRWWTGVLLAACLAVATTVMADGKAEQLRRTMAEIALLNAQLSQRKADALGIRDELTSRLEAVREEVVHELREKRITTRTDAMDQPRIHYNLLLMAEIKAYIERYTEKIAYYRVAEDRLGYLYQQADDDLKIVNTLSDLKIDALIAQAQKILDGYLSDAQTLVIQPVRLAPVPPETILAGFKALS